MHASESGQALVLTGRHWSGSSREPAELATFIAGELRRHLPAETACRVRTGPDFPGYPPLLVADVDGLPPGAPAGIPSAAAWHTQLAAVLAREGNEWNRIIVPPSRGNPVTREYEFYPVIRPLPPDLVLAGSGAPLRAALTGVRFARTVHCTRCRQPTELYSAGKITLGLRTSRTGKPIRWLPEVRNPGPLPPLPGSCLLCGEPAPVTSHDARESRPAEDPSAQPVIDSAYRQIRAAWPGHAAAADKARQHDAGTAEPG